jgi:hypothetical protein
VLQLSEVSADSTDHLKLIVDIASNTHEIAACPIGHALHVGGAEQSAVVGPLR